MSLYILKKVLEDPATESNPDTEIDPEVAVASREPLGRRTLLPIEREDPVSAIFEPRPGVAAEVPARAASSRTPLEEIE